MTADPISAFDGWYHRIEVEPGVYTPGCDDTPGKLAILDRLGFPADCTGLRMLDVGTCDGAFAFEARRRGADVVAIDVRPPEQNGFTLARDALKVWVDYHQRSVYSLHPATDGHFDIILFLGVLYHLRHPLLALDRLRQVVAPDGLMLIDTHSIERGVCDDHLGIQKDSHGVTAGPWALWQTFLDRGSPWIGFAPNVAGLREALYKTQWTMGEACEFVGSRLYTVAQPDTNLVIEAQIVAEGLR